MVVSGGNDPIIIDYGDTWPGPEAGQRVTYERNDDGSQGDEISRERAPKVGDTPRTVTRATVEQSGITDGIPKSIQPFTENNQINVTAAADAVRLGDKEVEKGLEKAGVSKDVIRQQVDFTLNSVKIDDNNYIPLDTWNNLPSDIQNTFRDKGMKAGKKAVAELNAKFYASSQAAEDKAISESLEKLAKQAETKAKVGEAEQKALELQYARLENIKDTRSRAEKTVDLLKDVEPIDREPSPQDSVTERLGIIKNRINKNERAIEEVAKQADLTPGQTAALMGGVAVTTLSPIPGDEVFATLVLVGTIGVAYAAKTISDHKQSHGELPKYVALAVNDGQELTFVPAGDLYPTGGLWGDTRIKTEQPKIIGFPLTPDKVVILDTPYTAKKAEVWDTPLTPDKVTILDFPLNNDEYESNIIASDGALKVAEDKTKAAIPKPVDEIPINYDKILDQVREAKKAGEIAAAFKEIDRVVRRYKAFKQDEASAFRRSYNEYLRRLRILNDARTQYVAATNPQPLKGTSNPERVAKAAALMIDSLIRLASDDKRVKKALKEYQDAYKRALDMNKTNTAEMQKALEALKQAADVATKQALQTQLRTKTKVATRPLTKAIPRTAERAIPREATATATTALTGAPAILAPPLPKLPKNASDKKKREFIKASNGAIGWRQGKIGEKDRWDVIVNPYEDNSHYVMVLGRKPEGVTIVRRGKGSAYATAQMLRGQAPKKQVRVDSGFQDITISGKDKNVRLDYKPDPQGLTRGDIQIGGRTPRISPRTPRISPKTPRLR